MQTRYRTKNNYKRKQSRLVFLIYSALIFALGFGVALLITPKKLPFQFVSEQDLIAVLPYKITKEYKLAQCQVEKANASEDFQKYYHEYYETVVERIKQLDVDEIEKKAILDYINGYEERKKLIRHTMFPREHFLPSEGGYGTKFSGDLPIAMQEFDRQELLMYRMILAYMYEDIPREDLDRIFAKKTCD